MDLDDFLVKAYAKQIKELNSSTGKRHLAFFKTYSITNRKLKIEEQLFIANTVVIFVPAALSIFVKNGSIFLIHIFSAKASYEILRHSRKSTCLGRPPPVTMLRDHYVKEVKTLRDHHKDYLF